MPFKIVRNDITKMNTEAIVNTANEEPMAGTGCDFAIYQAAGYEELLAYRKEKIGHVPEGEVFLTPGFRLPAKWIIHAVSPLYIDGNHKEEELLRSCYRKSLALAAEKGIRSISFPLISTGGFGYPREEGMRIAVDEIHAFLLTHDMQICLVVFNESSVRMGKNLYPDLEAYIDRNYVEQKLAEEYGEEPYRQALSCGRATDGGCQAFLCSGGSCCAARSGLFICGADAVCGSGGKSRATRAEYSGGPQKKIVRVRHPAECFRQKREGESREPACSGRTITRSFFGFPGCRH